MHNFQLLMCLLWVGLGFTLAQPQSIGNSPTTAPQVGPEAMPAESNPWQSPFQTPRPVETSFPADKRTLSFAAEPPTVADVTGTIQAAIDDLSSQGGGTVIIPPGKWPTGRIILKSNVCLHLPEGSELHFSEAIEDYLPAVFTRYEGIEVLSPGGLIYAYQAANIGVTGPGKLVGPAGGPLREARPGLSDQVVDPNSPLSERIMDGQEGRHYFRPYFICPVECQRVLIEGITLEHGPMWNVVPIYCSDVIIRGVSIDSRGVVNGDGIDIESSQNVLVEYCQVNTGDDCFVLKAGRDTDGLRTARPVENVVIRHCVANGGIGGITCGSETAGVIRRVYVHDCQFNNVRHAVYMKTRRPRGGGVEQLVLERIHFSTTNHAVLFDMIGSPLYVGELGSRLPRRELTPATPFYRSITMRQLFGTSSEGTAVKVKGIPESPASKILMEQCDIRAPDACNLADVRELTIRECKFSTQANSILILDGQRVNFVHSEFNSDQPLSLKVAGPQSRQIQFQHCSPPIATQNITASDGAELSEISVD